MAKKNAEDILFIIDSLVKKYAGQIQKIDAKEEGYLAKSLVLKGKIEVLMEILEEVRK